MSQPSSASPACKVVMSSQKRSSSPEWVSSHSPRIAPSGVVPRPIPSLPASVLSLIASYVAHPSPLPYVDLDGHVQPRPNRFGLRPEVGFELSGKPPPASYAAAAPSSSQGKGGKGGSGGGGGGVTVQPGGVLGRLGPLSIASKILRQAAMGELFSSVTVGEKRVVKVLLNHPDIVQCIRSLHVEHPNPTRPGLESTLLFLPLLLQHTPHLTRLSFHLPPCRLPSPAIVSPSCNLQLLQAQPSLIPHLTSIAIHHQICPACAAHVLDELGLGRRPHFRHLLLSGIVDHFDETVPSLPSTLETLLWVQIEFGFYGAGGGASVTKPAGMVERLARQCPGLVDLRVVPVAQDSFLVEEAHGGMGEWGEEFAHLLSLSPLLANLRYLDIGLTPLARHFPWPGFIPLPIPPAPKFATKNKSVSNTAPTSPSILSAARDHHFFAQLNYRAYQSHESAFTLRIIAALRAAFPKLVWGVFETVLETFEGGGGGGGGGYGAQWDEEDELWADGYVGIGRETAPRGRVAWEFVERLIEEPERVMDLEEEERLTGEKDADGSSGEVRVKVEGEPMSSAPKGKKRAAEVKSVPELVVYPVEAI